MTDKKADEQEQDEATTQQSLIDPPPVEIGQMVVIGNRGGKVIKISDNDKSVQVEFTLTDGGKSKRWEYICDIEDQPAPTGYEVETKVIPFISETDKLTNEICNLRTQLKEETDAKEHFERCHSILERQNKELKDEQQQGKTTVVNEVSATEFGELKAAQDQIAKLTARVIELENPPLPHLPAVEVKSLVREVNWELGIHDEPDIAKWYAEGYVAIESMSAWQQGLPAADDRERITFKRVNQQPIQPHHPLAEIDRAFDAQGQRDNPILNPLTPYTNLLRQGIEAEDIINTANSKAVTKARAAGLASQASHTPLSPHTFLPEVIKQ